MIVTADPVPLPYNPVTPSPRDEVQRLPNFPLFLVSPTKITWLVFCSPVKTTNPTQVPYSNPRVVVELTEASGHFHLEAHFPRVKSFTLAGNEEQLHSLIMSLQKGSGYVLLPWLTFFTCTVSDIWK